MMCLISGETVTVRNAAQSFDELGEPTGETMTEATVDNVVVARRDRRPRLDAPERRDGRLHALLPEGRGR